MAQQLRVAFIHPDLGIGGAEQLVVNLAEALQNEGHWVKIYTPYHDPKHCFPQTVDGTLRVEVRGNSIPQQIRGKCTALCAYLRMILCTLFILFRGGPYDLYIVDQVSFVLPILWLFRKRSIFYCHFPDKLLCVERSSHLKKAYRFFLDFFEEMCMFFGDLILVNSLFTRDIVSKAFPTYTKYSKKRPEVLYPAIDFKKFDSAPTLRKQDSRLEKGSFFVSLNRYERKKNIALAIHAFALFRQKLEAAKDEEFHNIKLVVAGGYEMKVQENKEHYDELNESARRLGVAEWVSFKRNVSDEERAFLLQNCMAVLYTPEREHFGIVPVEAMYNQAPVIACNSGGPKESVEDNKTGFLCETNAEVWCDKMIELYRNGKEASAMGERGRQRVIDLFGFSTFQRRIHEFALDVVGKRKRE